MAELQLRALKDDEIVRVEEFEFSRRRLPGNAAARARGRCEYGRQAGLPQVDDIACGSLDGGETDAMAVTSFPSWIRVVSYCFSR